MTRRGAADLRLRRRFEDELVRVTGVQRPRIREVVRCRFLFLSLACGTPVVAVEVGAAGGTLTSGAATDLIPSRSDRDSVRVHAVQFNGSAISKRHWDILTRGRNR